MVHTGSVKRSIGTLVEPPQSYGMVIESLCMNILENNMCAPVEVLKELIGVAENSQPLETSVFAYPLLSGAMCSSNIDQR
jgi:hypothetical protein